MSAGSRVVPTFNSTFNSFQAHKRPKISDALYRAIIFLVENWLGVHGRTAIPSTKLSIAVSRFPISIAVPKVSVAMSRSIAIVPQGSRGSSIRIRLVTLRGRLPSKIFCSGSIPPGGNCCELRYSVVDINEGNSALLVGQR